MKREVAYYVTDAGEEPFTTWLQGLSEAEQVMIMDYVIRVAAGGSIKNIAHLGDNLHEIRIHQGPGFRIYFVNLKRKMLILLGGKKGNQKFDIRTARRYWRNYGGKKQVV